MRHLVFAAMLLAAVAARADTRLVLDGNGNAVNRIVADPGFVPGPGLTTIPDDGRALYVPPTPNPTTISKVAFLARFTSTELLAIASAAQTQPAINSWLITAQAYDQINLLDPTTIAGVEALAAAGLITSERATVILTP